MPVYDRSYRPWDGERTPSGMRPVVIAEQGLRQAMRLRLVWVLLVGTLLHVAIRGGILYFTGQVTVPEGSIPPGVQDQIMFSSGFLADAMAFQARWILMILLALVASPALAGDQRAGALQFYFSKPLSVPGYVAGKLAPPVLLGLAVTALPVLILWVLGVAFTPEQLYPADVWLIPFMLVLAGFLVSLIAASIALAISGLVANETVAGAAWVALALLTAAGARLLEEITGRSDVGLIDLFGVLDRVTRDLIGAVGSSLPQADAWTIAFAWLLAGAGGVTLFLSRSEVGP